MYFMPAFGLGKAGHCKMRRQANNRQRAEYGRITIHSSSQWRIWVYGSGQAA